jgi:hypothetical protein
MSAEWERAGKVCLGIHEQLVFSQQLDLQQVQADEIKVKIQGGWVWMAMAIMVPTRLWIGGVIGPNRDKQLIRQLVQKVRAMALCRPLLLAVDGLPSYIKAFQAAFRSQLPRWGKPGRPQLVAWSDIAIVQVVKQRTAGLLTIERRIVQGCPQQIARLVTLSQKIVGVINTAYIERLNATFRLRLSCLTNQILSGTLYVGAFIAEISPWYALRGKVSRIGQMSSGAVSQGAIISTASTETELLPANCLDYIFVDPPFGSNIIYSDLSIIWESWLKLFTNTNREAVVHRRKKTGYKLPHYQDIMYRAFLQMFRALKPGHWMTVEFHNSQNAVWNAIQEAMLRAGFVVADVRTLDKRKATYQTSYNIRGSKTGFSYFCL